jgi:DUF4097 and DUF4098 domain-containing protein YvlB
MSNGIRRRGSIFTGLLLIVLGVLILLDRFDPTFGLGHLIRIYWPVLIILWGVAKLFDHFAARRTGEPRAALLSGGEAALMILLAFVLTGFVFRDWVRDRYPDFNFDLPPFHQSYSQSRELPPQALPPGARLSVDTELGDISIHPASGNELRVNANEAAWGPTESAAKEQMRSVDVLVEHTGNVFRIHPVNQDALGSRVRVDLDVAMPKLAAIEASTGHGDIEISGAAGSVVARTARGDVDIHDTGGDVAADLQHGDVRITTIAGNVKLTGRGNDVQLSAISGDASVDGAFVGSIQASNVAKSLRCVSPWADLAVIRLNGRLEADHADIQVSDAGGPLKIVARNKDIDIANVSGQIEINNTHGEVKISYSTPPRDDLTVTDDASDIDLTLPAASSFGVSAISRSGEADSDFKGPFIKESKENGNGQISGKVGSGGPAISVKTSYGTIHLRKAGS